MVAGALWRPPRKYADCLAPTWRGHRGRSEVSVMNGPAFEVELLLGAGVTIPIRLSEDAVTASRDSSVRAAIGARDREGLRRGAVEIIYAAITRNQDQPLMVEDGETTWLIPTRSVRAARFRDPTATAGEQRIGFRPDRYAPSGEPR